MPRSAPRLLLWPFGHLFQRAEPTWQLQVVGQMGWGGRAAGRPFTPGSPAPPGRWPGAGRHRSTETAVRVSAERNPGARPGQRASWPLSLMPPAAWGSPHLSFSSHGRPLLESWLGPGHPHRKRLQPLGTGGLQVWACVLAGRDLCGSSLCLFFLFEMGWSSAAEAGLSAQPPEQQGLRLHTSGPSGLFLSSFGFDLGPLSLALQAPATRPQ